MRMIERIVWPNVNHLGDEGLDSDEDEITENISKTIYSEFVGWKHQKMEEEIIVATWLWPEMPSWLFGFVDP